MLSEASYRFHLQKYAISGQSNQPNSINGQKPSLCRFGSFKNAILSVLNDPSQPGNCAKCWKPFSSITICSIKSIPQTKILDMAKNLFFGNLDHSKMDFYDFWIVLNDLMTLPNTVKQFVLSQYALSTQSNRRNSWKCPKTSFLALWIIQKCIFAIFEWSFMTWWLCQMQENI